MIKLGLEKRGVWAKLREARAARRDGNGLTLLHLACLAGVDDVQRACEQVEFGWPGSVDARTAIGWTPLMCASNRGHSCIVKALLAAGADLNAATNYGWTALICACFHGRLESARLLVAAKALVNARSTDGYTPLHLARGRGGHANPAIVALLLAAGATDDGED
jgi:ankyrin repeat protein